MSEMLDKFILPHDDEKQTHLGFVIADYDKSINKKLNWALLRLDKEKSPEEWVVGGGRHTLKFKLESDRRFKVSDNSEYNNEIGFLTKSGQNVVFKTKRTLLEASERVNKGIRCPSAGEKEMLL